MTWKQYGQAAVSIAAKKLGADVRDYKPDYTECLDHFLLHAGNDRVYKTGSRCDLGLTGSQGQHLTGECCEDATSCEGDMSESTFNHSVSGIHLLLAVNAWWLAVMLILHI